MGLYSAVVWSGTCDTQHDPKGDEVRTYGAAYRVNCGFHDTHQRAGPGIGKALQIVSGDIQIAEGLEGVHEDGGELSQPIVS